MVVLFTCPTLWLELCMDTREKPKATVQDVISLLAGLPEGIPKRPVLIDCKV